MFGRLYDGFLCLVPFLRVWDSSTQMLSHEIKVAPLIPCEGVYESQYSILVRLERKSMW